jgi:hypothetical protein
MINQAKLKAYRCDPFWKFGVLVPRNAAHAMALDKADGTIKWQDAEGIEEGQLLEYNTFINRGKGGSTPNGYKKIRCHMIYNVKHDGHHKAHLVAGGHLTDPKPESVYSGVVSFHSI